MKTNERAKYTYLTLQLLPTEKEREALQMTWDNYKKACNTFSRIKYLKLAKGKHMDVSACKKEEPKSARALAQRLLHAVYENSIKYTVEEAYKNQEDSKKLALIVFGEYDETNVKLLAIPYFRKPTFTVDFSTKKCRLDLAKNFQKIAFTIPKGLPEPPESWEVKRAYLKLIYGTWYLTLGFSNPTIKTEVKPDTHIVGIDRGEINIATTYSPDKGAKRYSAKDYYTSCKGGTKDDYHKNLFAKDVIVAQEIVERESPDTIFVLEDLHFNKLRKGWSYRNFSDAFIYLAALHHQCVFFCDPRNTSRTCPKCGEVTNTKRNRDEHRFICHSCGYGKNEIVNDDENAAENIYLRGRKELLKDDF